MVEVESATAIDDPTSQFPTDTKSENPQLLATSSDHPTSSNSPDPASSLKAVKASILTSQTYIVQKRLISPATIVLKVFNKTGHKCIKLWRPLKNEIYDTVDPNKNNTYTLQGLAFNQKVAPGVYLGIAPIVSDFHDYARTIKLGSLISKPTEADIQDDKRYALVMRFLNQKWRLDQQIGRHSLPSKDDIKFLALQIADMQEQTQSVSSDHGSLEKLHEKWNLNKKYLKEALNHPSVAKLKNNTKESMPISIDNVDSFAQIMEQALKVYANGFSERSQCLKHCHGDLKTNNLWLIPKVCSEIGNTQKNYPKPRWRNKQLIALDCIDFNPLFSYIDPLSDAAMLIMDLEELLSSLTKTDLPKKCTHMFLEEYLAHAIKDPDTFSKGYLKPIMEFYIAEKAIVCAYVSILSDRRPLLGLRYLRIAHSHLNLLSKFVSEKKQSNLLTESFTRKQNTPSPIPVPIT